MNFIDAVGDWKSNDEWQYADKEAAWKFFFAAGKESSQAVISAQCVKMSRISPSYVTGLEKYIDELLNQVSSLKAELREICAAIDDPACDLTLTAVECIKRLKAENESLKRDAERLDFILRKQLIVIQDCDDKYFTYNAQSGKRGPEMDSEAEAIDAAMIAGDKNVLD